MASLHIDYEKKTAQIEMRFVPSQTVFFVEKKSFGRVQIVKDKIWAISFTNILNYSTQYKNKWFDDDSRNVFETKEEAYAYAETLLRRRKIKLKELC